MNLILDTVCPECFGVGTTEMLLVLDKPELDNKGRLILYQKKTLPCKLCQARAPISIQFQKIPA